MKKIILMLPIIVSILGCQQSTVDDNRFKVVTTTSMITDLVKNIGGDKVVVNGLMGAGVDPHLYKASAGDVAKFSQANMIFYNGLHLEGKLDNVFEQMKRHKVKTVAISDALDKNQLISSAEFESNYDPHIWFDIDNWITITLFVAEQLSLELPQHKAEFMANARRYTTELQTLKAELQQQVSEIPVEHRRLITAHDAFSYFGKAFEFEVVGLQGLSTTTEAGVQDVQNTAAYIINHTVKAIFIESSVPKRTVEALQAAVNSKNHQVKIGGTLYSDSLGNPDGNAGTYIGMFRTNVNTIVTALK